ncbi:MAG: peptide deformylase [Bacteroidota bacterium]
MKNSILALLVALSVILLSCKKDSVTPEPQPSEPLFTPFTQAETDLIMSGDTNVPMAILLTTNLQDSIFLRGKSIEIEPNPNDPTLKHLIKRMYYTMIAAGGVGIAAPQVGIHRKIFWFKRFDILPAKPFQVAINPKVDFYSQRKVNFLGDGCLSVPSITGKTERYSSILVEYYLENGLFEKNILEGTSATSFTSVCFQHEFDHLGGILFVDRIVAK